MDTLNLQLKESQKLLELTLAAQKCIETKIQSKVEKILTQAIITANKGKGGSVVQQIKTIFNSDDNSRTIVVVFNHVKCTFVIEDNIIDISYSEQFYGVSYSILHNIVEAIEKEKLLG